MEQPQSHSTDLRGDSPAAAPTEASLVGCLKYRMSPRLTGLFGLEKCCDEAYTPKLYLVDRKTSVSVKLDHSSYTEIMRHKVDIDSFFHHGYKFEPFNTELFTVHGHHSSLVFTVKCEDVGEKKRHVLLRLTKYEWRRLCREKFSLTIQMRF